MTGPSTVVHRSSRGLASVVVLVAIAGLGCGLLPSGDQEPATKTDTPAVAAPASAKAAGDAPRAPSLLDGVIDSAIEPPPKGGSTYRVDAYLAALVTEQLRRNPLPFTGWRGSTDDPAKPSAGYRVGPLTPEDLWTRLGLAEGDIVTEVNGVPTGAQGWAAQALERGENRVTVTVVRDDISFVLSYRLMGGLAWSSLIAQGGAPPPTDAGAVALADDGGEGGDGDVVAGGESDPARGSAAQPQPQSPRTTGSAAGGGSSSRPSPSKPSSGSSRPKPNKGTVARCSSASQCTVDKAYFDSIVRSPSKLESQANIVPAIRNDVHSGYKLKSVRSGTAVSQLGFRSGDKITHINGRDLTNELEAMQLYLGLSGTRNFRVRFERGGSARTKNIRVE